MSRPALAAALTAFAAALVAAPTVFAADQWKQYGATCDKTTFKSPQQATVDELAKCVRLWEAYKDVSKVKGDERDRVVSAMKRLYVEGSDTDAHVSKLALQRLKVTELPERPDPSASKPKRADKAGDAPSAQVEAPASGRKKCDVPKPSDKDIKAAEKAIKAGLGQYKKKKYEAALAQFLKAVEAAPGYARSHYNAAAMYAMTDDEAKAVEHLRCMQDIGDDEAVTYLKKAKTDKDFDGIKGDSKGFKEVTGYVRVKVGNGLGELGEENVDNLEMTLEKLGYDIEVVPAGPKEGYPIIWYQHHARVQAMIMKDVVRHPETKMVPLDEGEHDVVILWDDKVKKGDAPRVYVPDPDDAEKSLDAIARKQDEALRKPEEVTRKVDHTLETPDRIEKKVDKITDAPGKTIDKIEKTGKKLEKLFK